MIAQPKSTARKQPVNRAQNEDLATQARGLTDKLPGLVESLPVGKVGDERQQQLAEATAAVWNDLNATRGSFADEYSPLFGDRCGC